MSSLSRLTLLVSSEQLRLHYLAAIEMENGPSPPAAGCQLSQSQTQRRRRSKRLASGHVITGPGGPIAPASGRKYSPSLFVIRVWPSSPPSSITSSELCVVCTWQGNCTWHGTCHVSRRVACGRVAGSATSSWYRQRPIWLTMNGT